MKKAILCIVAAILIISTYCCTSTTGKIKVIKAVSNTVDIRDGQKFYKSYWLINPDLKPDVYATDNDNKKVTFYTDIDSISFDVEPNKTYDFVILINGKDSAWTQIQTRPSRLDILKQASAYNTSDDRPTPSWTYLSKDDPNLKRIRKTFNLDSIAGNGSETSKIINLLYWVHDAVRHDGSIDNPQSKNAIDLINICRKENRGINCRMMATILNECYLSMGFKSRFVTCMPKELKFDDCHVINMVYSNELGKWVWMDPTFAAYVKDENGILLGIEEVRERLINDKPLILNSDANWNHQHIQTKEYYLDKYMAKNLYRIEAVASSSYNVETARKNRKVDYIQLIPLGGIEQSPQKHEHVDEKSNSVITHYKTNNPEKFWAVPK